jgi:hypothetical protein
MQQGVAIASALMALFFVGCSWISRGQEQTGNLLRDLTETASGALQDLSRRAEDIQEGARKIQEGKKLIEGGLRGQ